MTQPPPLRRRSRDGANAAAERRWSPAAILAILFSVLMLCLLLAFLLQSSKRGVASKTDEEIAQATASEGTGAGNSEEATESPGSSEEQPQTGQAESESNAMAVTADEAELPATGSAETEPEEDPVYNELVTETPEDDAEFLPKSSKGNQSLAPVHRRIRFYGIETEGSHVVYVIDKSSSMSGERFEQAKAQLMQSLKELAPNQKFSIYFFDEGPLVDKRFIETAASKSNVSQVKIWLDSIYASGGTDPLPACELALEGSGDAIFLLSDGEFFGEDQIFSINSRRVKISTISLGGESQTLKQVAAQNGGKYRVSN